MIEIPLWLLGTAALAVLVLWASSFFLAFYLGCVGYHKARQLATAPIHKPGGLNVAEAQRKQREALANYEIQKMQHAYLRGLQVNRGEYSGSPPIVPGKK